MPNRLSRETSPYLLQHQNNPVDWYPWGEEALTRARSENKPILLSIGYSACHWCHVMEHESFENPATAKLMNEHFINIKVDREERPDLDHIYQNVAQAITRGGGWPLTVFLTPELKPFFGGTYFPPEDRWGRPGFPRVLEGISEAFRSDAEGVADNAKKLTEYISSAESLPESLRQGTGTAPEAASLKAAAENILTAIDWENGGLQGAPKFPNVMLLTYLWRFGQMTGMARARDAAILSLERMASGGIFDQLGGGWHRYSVDDHWAVPHFEKMLYDNALLMKLTAEVLLSEDALDPATRELLLGSLTRTVDYVLREMTSPEGAFYAAQDADSEGAEGKFFVWDPEELSSLLTEDEARVFARHHGVTPDGNFEHGKTVLHLSADAQTDPQSRLLLASAAKKLKAARDTRIAPATDRKILASWNGLMISGMVWAARALASQPALAAAEKAFAFLSGSLKRDGGRLWSTFQEGQGKHNAYLDDYAFMARAALDLGELDSARGWVQTIFTHFSDSSAPGFFFTSDDHESLIHRPKTFLDQAIPSGTAVALEVMLALGELDPESCAKLADEAEKQLFRLYPVTERAALGAGELLCTALLQFQGPIAVLGQGASEACFHPHVFLKPVTKGAESRSLLCHDRTCREVSGGAASLVKEVQKFLKE